MYVSVCVCVCAYVYMCICASAKNECARADVAALMIWMMPVAHWSWSSSWSTFAYKFIHIYVPSRTYILNVRTYTFSFHIFNFPRLCMPCMRRQWIYFNSSPCSHKCSVWVCVHKSEWTWYDVLLCIYIYILNVIGILQLPPYRAYLCIFRVDDDEAVAVFLVFIYLCTQNGHGSAKTFRSSSSSSFSVASF